MNVAVRFVAPGPSSLALGNLPVLHGNEKYPGTCIVKLPGTGLERSKLVSATSIVTPSAERTEIFVCQGCFSQPKTRRNGINVQVLVRDNNVDQALALSRRKCSVKAFSAK
jgi:hypothetical protein